MLRIIFLSLFLISAVSLAQPAATPLQGLSPKPESGAPEAASAQISTAIEEDGNLGGAGAGPYLGPWMGHYEDKTFVPWSGNADIVIRPSRDVTSFGKSMCSLISMCDENNIPRKRLLFVIHVVDWSAAPDDLPDPSQPESPQNPRPTITTVSYKVSHYYFFKSDGNGRLVYLEPDIKDDDTYTLPDIYDVDNGYIISVSRLTTTPTQTKLLPPSISYAPAVTEITPTWLAGLLTIASSLSGVSVSATADTKGASGGPPNPEVYKARIRIQQISVGSIRRPFSVAVAGTASGQNSATLDCTKLTSTNICAFQTTVPVSARDFVAFGIGIIPYGPRETKFNADGTSHTSNHNNFYGLIDFAPLPARFPMKAWPYFQFGLPLTDAAFHLPYAGMAYPIPLFRKQLAVSVFGGFMIMQQQGPTGARDRAIKGLWGIEVPIASLAKQLPTVTGNASKKGN